MYFATICNYTETVLLTGKKAFAILNNLINPVLDPHFLAVFFEPCEVSCQQLQSNNSLWGKQNTLIYGVRIAGFDSQ